jgi:hypothetical protein
MSKLVKTREMSLGPMRVPVMMKKNVAADLASTIVKQEQRDYDATMEDIIRLGIDAYRRRRARPVKPKTI